METQTYPVIMPAQDETFLRFTILDSTKDFKKGPIENWIMVKLRLAGVTFLRNDIVVCIDGHRYEPDLVYVDEKEGIYVDIEIDEPYTWKGRPCHCIDESGLPWDVERDRRFTGTGWMVIRISERQIFSQTKSCIGLVASAIASLDQSFAKRNERMLQWGAPDKESRRRPEQSRTMASENFRQTYLGFKPGKINMEEVFSFARHELSSMIRDRLPEFSNLIHYSERRFISFWGLTFVPETNI